jgi:hypothetical protein
VERDGASNSSSSQARQGETSNRIKMKDFIGIRTEGGSRPGV